MYLLIGLSHNDRENNLDEPQGRKLSMHMHV